MIARKKFQQFVYEIKTILIYNKQECVFIPQMQKHTQTQMHIRSLQMREGSVFLLSDGV